MLTVGDRLPEFDLQAAVSLDRGKEFTRIGNQSYPGRWLVLFSWPMDFTFVCPTEIAEVGKRTEDFRERDAQVLGMSTDTHFVHLAWRRDHADLKDLPFPMLADDLSVGRNVDEVVRVLDALQTGELCPCNWRMGDATLQVAWTRSSSFAERFPTRRRTSA
ncbi:MAG TPA: peroxiredoxin [Methylomirabilota bacterium]|nr:peroxiredoxin [Methylomirabilota bacterium]